MRSQRWHLRPLPRIGLCFLLGGLTFGILLLGESKLPNDGTLIKVFDELFLPPFFVTMAMVPNTPYTGFSSRFFEVALASIGTLFYAAMWLLLSYAGTSLQN